MNPSDIALSFHNLSVSHLHPPKSILRNVSGYVTKGGITAVMGECASGKSVLLKCLAGRMRNFLVSGEVTLDGKRIDSAALHNPISYVPQTEFLMGEYTPREVLTFNSLMKQRKSRERVAEEVDRLLCSFGLSHVADNMIGTIFVRGLSGGQRKRVEICSELIAADSMLLLDEPTSGLDGSIAYEILVCIKKLLLEKRGSLSILLSIHQPNQRILELFDNIMLLHQGKSVFFGTLSESIDYFTSIGYAPNPLYTPTDYFLQVTSQVLNHSTTTTAAAAAASTSLPLPRKHAGTAGAAYLACSTSEVVGERNREMIEFAGQFRCSKYGIALYSLLHEVQNKASNSYSNFVSTGSWKQVLSPKSRRAVSPKSTTQPWDNGLNNSRDIFDVAVEGKSLIKEKQLSTFEFNLRQFGVLIQREFILAQRDPTLYYLQAVLMCIFCFNIGASYFNLHPAIDAKLMYVETVLFWLCQAMCFSQIFKIYHLSRNNARFEHEISNNTYDTNLYWLAEVLTTMVFIGCVLPASLVTYSMTNLPMEAYPFCLFALWLTAFTAESFFYIITKFAPVATVAIIISQSILVILQVFGGLYIPWKDCPPYWLWVQAISIFTQSCRTMYINENQYIIYPCTVNALGECRNPLGILFPCDHSVPNTAGVCEVSGRAVMNVIEGIPYDESRWIAFGYLALICILIRIASLFFMHFPFDLIVFRVQQIWMGGFAKVVIDQQSRIDVLEEQLQVFWLMHEDRDHRNEIANTNAHTSTVRRNPSSMSTQQFELLGQRTGPSFDDTVENNAEGFTFDTLMHKEGDEEGTEVAQQVSDEMSDKRSIKLDLNLSVVIPPRSMMISLSSSPPSKDIEGHTLSDVPSAGLMWKNLSVTLTNGSKHRLLDSLSGIASAGRILALMGPSGAGKTTLLNALSHRIPYATMSGDIRYGDRNLTAKDLVYVPQFDEFNPNFTVFETMEYIGMMKCDDHNTVRHRTWQLVQLLGLSGKMDMLTKCLTNGELKRVSVGMGMISNPNVLFLDEPTTGLDSNAAYTIVKYLTKLCTVTKVVMIMTIHQPAQMVFDMLQDLYLLENGGRLAYAGPVNTAEAYFASIGGKEMMMRTGERGIVGGRGSGKEGIWRGFHCPTGVNVCDFYLDLVNTSPTTASQRLLAPETQSRTTNWEKISSEVEKEVEKEVEEVEEDGIEAVYESQEEEAGAEHWSEYFTQSTAYALLATEIASAGAAGDLSEPSWMVSTTVPVSRTSYGHRLWYTMKYFATYYYRDHTIFHIRIFFLILIATFLGTLYLNLQPTTDQVAQYSGATLFSVYTTVACSLWTTKAHTLDRIRVLEQLKNDVLTPSMYCLAQFLVSLPAYLLCAIIFQSIFHWLTNLNSTGECFVYAICITVGHMMLMEGVILCVVGVFHTAMLSITFSLVLMGALLLFTGYLIPIADMPIWISWICYAMPTKYSLNGYVWSVMIDHDFLISGLPVPMTVSGEYILDQYYDLRDINPWGYWGILVVYVLSIRCLHYYILYRSIVPYLSHRPRIPSNGVVSRTAVKYTFEDDVIEE